MTTDASGCRRVPWDSRPSRLLAGPRRVEVSLHNLDPETVARDLRDRPDMALVGCHNDIASSANGAFDNRHIDHIIMAGPTSQLADVPGLIGAHLLYVTTGEHACQARLTTSTPPGLGKDRRRHDRYDLFGHEADM
jgi:hypothetical protein